MDYYSFNPFSKNIDKINGEDLFVLKDISEGWYVDYKENIIKIPKIAKHMSAFANQYGGWLFFGIKESEARTAGRYVGVDKDEVSKLLISIREAITAHSSPEIYYKEKIIEGPCNAIGLPEDKSIVILYIPDNVINLSDKLQFNSLKL